MKTIYLASYKSRETFVDKAIQWITKGSYSHSEIFIMDEYGYVIGITSAGTEGGVKLRPVINDPSKWDLIELPFVSEQQIYDWYDVNKSDKYDWFGIVRFLFPFALPQHQSAWFCSECCADIIKFKDAWRYDPSTLHDAVERLVSHSYNSAK